LSNCFAGNKTAHLLSTLMLGWHIDERKHHLWIDEVVA
jgi:hypothetical protein